MAVGLGDHVLGGWGIVAAAGVANHQAGRQPGGTRQDHHGGGVIIAVALLKLKQKVVGHIAAGWRLGHVQGVWESSQVGFDGGGFIVGGGCLGSVTGGGQLEGQLAHPFGERFGQLQVARQHPLRDGARGGAQLFDAGLGADRGGLVRKRLLRGA